MQKVVAIASMLMCACSMVVTDDSEIEELGLREQSLQADGDELQLQSSATFDSEISKAAALPLARMIRLADESIPDPRLPALDCVQSGCAVGGEQSGNPNVADRPCPTCNVCAWCALSQANKLLAIKIGPSVFGPNVTQVKAPRLFVNGAIVWSNPSQLAAGPLYAAKVASLPSNVSTAKVKFDVLTSNGLTQTMETVVYSP